MSQVCGFPKATQSEVFQVKEDSEVSLQRKETHIKNFTKGKSQLKVKHGKEAQNYLIELKASYRLTVCLVRSLKVSQ